MASRKPLVKLVNTWVKTIGISHEDAWHQVNAAVNVSKVEYMTNSQVKEAILWVQSRLDAVQTLPIPQRQQQAAPFNINDAHALLMAVTQAIKASGQQGTQKVHKAYGPTQPIVYNLLRHNNGGMTVAELSAASGLTADQTRNALYNLRNKGHAFCTLDAAKDNVWVISKPLPTFDPAIMEKLGHNDPQYRYDGYADWKYGKERDYEYDLEERLNELGVDYHIQQDALEAQYFFMRFEDIARSFPNIMRHYYDLTIENLELNVKLAEAA